jgi:hypothetical protein
VIALATWQWVGGAIATPALGYMAVACTKAMSRWLGRAITRTISEAITGTTQPQLAAVEQRLSDQIAAVGIAGSAEHTAVVTRVSILEGRVTAIELRLTPTPATED